MGLLCHLLTADSWQYATELPRTIGSTPNPTVTALRLKPDLRSRDGKVPIASLSGEVPTFHSQFGGNVSGGL
jgi:hypothetical protein